MDKKKIIMIGVGVLFLILIIRNITFVAVKPETTTKTATVVYRNPPNVNTYYVNTNPPRYNSYKAQYYN
jgi:hypothetical protein